MTVSHQYCLGTLCMLAVTIIVTGCAHKTLNVAMAPAKTTPPSTPPDWASNTSTVPGIPFYVKRGVCKKETVWLEPQYRLTLTIAVDDDPPLNHTLVLSRAGYLSDRAQALITTLSAISGKYTLDEIYNHACPATIGKDWTAVKDTASYRVKDGLDTSGSLGTAEANGNVIRTANTAKIDSAADYTHQYYINSNSPWIGTSQIDAKIATDGTLTEGSGQVDDQTWSTILTTISSLVGDFTGAAAAAAPAAPPPTASGSQTPAFVEELRNLDEKRRNLCPGSPGWPSPIHKITYKFKIETSLYEHDHTDQSFDLANGCKPEDNGVTGGSFKVSEKSSAPTKKNENAIEISGEVTLPDKSKGRSGESSDSSSSKKP